MRQHKIIFDSDPGVDDAMALLLALRSPEIEIAGIGRIRVAPNPAVANADAQARRAAAHARVAELLATLGVASIDDAKAGLARPRWRTARA